MLGGGDRRLRTGSIRSIRSSTRFDAGVCDRLARLGMTWLWHGRILVSVLDALRHAYMNVALWVGGGGG